MNEYLYDLDGTVCGLKHNDTAYYFYKNLQGDVIAITDDTGATVARYTYDAWGKCAIVSDNSGVGIATVNPFRYRSYYYDTETELYYLQSRYYSPEVGRFINADDAKVICSVFNTKHQGFAFCNNDPVFDYELDGYISIRATIMIVCALANAINMLSIACNLINQKWFKSNYSVSFGLTVCFIAFVIGGIIGLINGSKFTGGWNLFCGVVGAIVSVASYVSSNQLYNKKFTPNELVWRAVMGFVRSIAVPANSKIPAKIVYYVLGVLGKNSLTFVADWFL